MLKQIVTVLAILLLAGCSSETQVKAWGMIEEDNALLVDVRTPQEFNSGHLPGAKLIPVDQLKQRLAEFGPNKNRPIVVYCKSGSRSGKAEQFLKSQGYTNVFNGGGYNAMKNAKDDYETSKLATSS